MVVCSKPCNICGGTLVRVDEGFEVRGKRVQKIYAEYCVNCHNLLFGNVKVVEE